MTYQYKSNKLKETNSSLSQDDLKPNKKGSNSMIIRGARGAATAATGSKKMKSDAF